MTVSGYNSALHVLVITNSLRFLYSIDEEDESAATVDIVEGEQEAIEYSYPSNPLVSFSDLPGYGSPTHPDVEAYWKKFNLKNFDIFLLFITSRIMELDLAILRKVKPINKLLFIIRTKVDIDIEFMQKRKSQIEGEVLSEIRNYIVRYADQLLCAENIFLISNYDPYKWDFFNLIEAIMNVMPDPNIGK